MESTKVTKFRFGAQRALLTYREHLPKAIYVEWLRELVNLPDAKIRLAHETGDAEAPYHHTHVVVDFGGRFQTTRERFFDFPFVQEDGSTINIHPHIKVLKNIKAHADALIYISKEDPENSDLKEKPSLVTGILATSTPVEALRQFMVKPSDVMGILAIHALRDGDYRTIKKDWSSWEPYPWQKELIDMIENVTPNGRDIHWVYDKKGRKGKSVLGEYLEDNYADQVYFFDDLGNAREAATVLEGVFQSGWAGNTIIIDLTRCAEHHDRMYDYLERLANGRITSQKYKGKRLKFDKPHIIVFSNFTPHTDKMSLDRWQIKTINDDYELVKLSVNDIIKIQKENSCELPEDSPYRIQNWPSSKK